MLIYNNSYFGDYSVLFNITKTFQKYNKEKEMKTLRVLLVALFVITILALAGCENDKKKDKGSDAPKQSCFCLDSGINK